MQATDKTHHDASSKQVGLTKTYREVVSKQAGSTYDKILAGLSAVLAELGKEMTVDEISALFHWPLAKTPLSTPLCAIVKGMLEALPVGTERQPLVNYVSQVRFSSLGDEKDVRRQLRQLEAEEQTLAQHIEDTRLEVSRCHRKAGIVGELVDYLFPVEKDYHSLVTDCLRRAEILESVAVDAEEWINTTRRSLEDRLVELPVERARSVQPISGLRLRSQVFGYKYGGRVGEIGRYVFDGCMLFDSARVVGTPARKRAERLAAGGSTKEPPSPGQGGGGFTQERLARYISDADDETRQKPAVVCGFLDYDVPSRTGRQIPLAVVLIDGSDVVYVDADYVRLIDSLFGGRTVVRVHFDEKDRRTLVFYFGDDTVAVLAPTSHKAPIDVEVLRDLSSSM